MKNISVERALLNSSQNPEGDYRQVFRQGGSNGYKIGNIVHNHPAERGFGSEISFMSIPQKEELPCFHFHNKDEETYINIKGSGYDQVDDDCFPIREGSLIHANPAGRRGSFSTYRGKRIQFLQS